MIKKHIAEVFQPINRTKKQIFNILFGSIVLLNFNGAHAAQNCVAGNWISPPNTYWGAQTTFPVRAESAHFQFRWDDQDVGKVTLEDTNKTLAHMEKVWSWFMGDVVDWTEPFCNSAEKHKVQIFLKDGYGMSGSGAGERSPAMWINQNIIPYIAKTGDVGGFTHEFTHTLQFASGGLRETDFGGWMWESHAEFMATQYMRTIGSAMFHAWNPHMYFGSTRLRYANWIFWNFLKDKYGFEAVNSVWDSTAFIKNQDPLIALKTANGWTQAELGDLFGEYAMKNVNWDYIDRQDGYDRGNEMRNAFSKNSQFTSGDQFKDKNRPFRLARMDAINQDKRQFVVSKYFAPQRYGYNIVRLFPDTNAQSIKVDFHGVVQDAPQNGAQIGTRAFEPGAKTTTGDWSKYSLPNNPASDWRWGIVAINSDGKSRYSALQSGINGSLSFDILPNEVEFYLTVAATPSEHHSIFWDQKYHSLYRYPYKIQLSGAMPEGFQAGYNVKERNQFTGTGRFHANGGGWVSSNATVAETAYVGPHAAVLGGTVTENARIEDYATVRSGSVSGNAIIGGVTQVINDTVVKENAQIHSVMSNDQSFSPRITVAGATKFYGDIEAHIEDSIVESGAYSGFLLKDWLGRPEHGADLTSKPIEVTKPVTLDWPYADNSNPIPTIVLNLPITTNVYNKSGYIEATPVKNAASIKKVEFYTGNVLLNTVNAAPYVLNWDNVADGTYVVTAKVYNAQGGNSTSNPITIVINSNAPNNNKLPTISLGQPVASAGNKVGYIEATAADADGLIAKVEFYYGNTLLFTSYKAPFRASWSNAPDGTYSLSAKAYDNQGGVSSSSAVSVTISTAVAITSENAAECAVENEICKIPTGITATVWYGAQSSWIQKTGVTNAIECNNQVFTDPIVGVGKICKFINSNQ